MNTCDSSSSKTLLEGGSCRECANSTECALAFKKGAFICSHLLGWAGLGIHLLLHPAPKLKGFMTYASDLEAAAVLCDGSSRAEYVICKIPK